MCERDSAEIKTNECGSKKKKTFITYDLGTHHSTETALINIINDIRFNSDSGKISVLRLTMLIITYF